MSLRPRDPKLNQVRRAGQRMAPGGRRWSESPIPRFAARRVPNMGIVETPPAFDQFRGPIHHSAWPSAGTAWPALDTLTLDTTTASTGDGMLVVTFTTEAAVTPASGWTEVGTGTVGGIYWGAWWGEIGAVAGYTFNRGTTSLTSKDAMYVWNFSSATPTPQAVSSGAVDTSTGSVPYANGGLASQLTFLVGLTATYTTVGWFEDPTSGSSPYRYPFSPSTPKIEGRSWVGSETSATEGAGIVLASYYTPGTSVLVSPEAVSIESQQYVIPTGWEVVSDSDVLTLHIGWPA